ncbi:MAG: ROK family protein [Candidatus Binataceae bacterium]
MTESTQMPGKVWIGVDIGGTKTAVVLSIKPPAVESRLQFATRPARGPGHAVDSIREGIATMLAARRLSNAAIAGIGVSCGSPQDRIRGIIQAPPNLATWVNVPIKSILEEQFGAPCRIENDANAGAVAEHRYGAGRGFMNMVFLTMGTGLGAGVIVDGRLYRGTNDMAGEIGHLRLTRSGPIGNHKQGSAEGWASGGGVAKVAHQAVIAARKRGIQTILGKHLQPGKQISARDVTLAAAKGDAVARRIITSTGKRLGQVLAILVDVLNPQRIVIGGLAMRMGETLLQPARETIKREALGVSAESCEIVPAALGERIGDVAALCVAMGICAEPGSRHKKKSPCES